LKITADITVTVILINKQIRLLKVNVNPLTIINNKKSKTIKKRADIDDEKMALSLTVNAFTAPFTVQHITSKANNIILELSFTYTLEAEKAVKISVRIINTINDINALIKHFNINEASVSFLLSALFLIKNPPHTLIKSMKGTF
jgi:Neuraminidase (sialidase)